MKLSTPVQPDEFSFKADYRTRFVSIGSCFANNMADYLSELKFNILSNPAGVLYNPMSVASCIEKALNSYPYSEKNLNFDDGLYFNFDFHGSFAKSNAQECLSVMNQTMSNTAYALKNCNVLLITFGSSWVYTLKDSGNIVANCHKQPANQFIRSRLTQDEIVKTWASTIENITAINPNINIVFTVSPIRHLSEGAHANNLSKAVLLLAVEKLTSISENCHYFPSYEIVLDELRDYRFYNSDWLHLNKTAIDIVWEKFSEAVFTVDTLQLISEVDKINKALAHRVFNTHSLSHRKFEEYLVSEIEKIKKLIPGIEFLNDKNPLHLQ